MERKRKESIYQIDERYRTFKLMSEFEAAE